MIENIETYEKKLYDALVIFKQNNELTENLCELFQELIEHNFTKRLPIFPSEEIKEDCESFALLTCLESVKKFDPDKINPRTGVKINPRVYFSIVIRSALAGGYVKGKNHKKYFQNES